MHEIGDDPCRGTDLTTLRCPAAQCVVQLVVFYLERGRDQEFHMPSSIQINADAVDDAVIGSRGSAVSYPNNPVPKHTG